MFDRERIEEASLLCDPGVLFAATQQGMTEEALLKAAARRWRDSDNHSPSAADELLQELVVTNLQGRDHGRDQPR